MKNRATVLFIKSIISIGWWASILYTNSAHALFEGDVKLACEAVLCLSSKDAIKECAPSIERYYSIKFKKRVKTDRARQKFLNICPR